MDHWRFIAPRRLCVAALWLLETVCGGVRRTVFHPNLVSELVSSLLLCHVMPCLASTIRLWANTPSPMADWKRLNPR